MQNEFINHPHNVYSAYLKIIGGKEFTSRELDVIACIVCGRSATVSTFLSISPKTVSAHISNILQKISGNSREDIINFIEKSDQYSLVKKYYQNLVIYFSFETYLVKKLSPLKGINTKNNAIYTRSQLRESMVFIRDLEKHLNLLNVKACHLKKEASISLVKHIQSHPDECFILILSESEIEHLKTALNSKILILQNLIQSSPQDQFNENLVVVYGEASAGSKNLCIINFKEYSNYYLAIFNVLKNLSPSIDSDQLSEEFMQLVQTLEDPSELPRTSLNNSLVAPLHAYVEFLRKNPVYFFSAIFVFVFSLSCFVVFLLKDRNLSVVTQDKNTHIIRSDLLIPTESVFFKRPKTIYEMEIKLEENQGKTKIAVVIIAGIGGAGKTALARYYAQSLSFSVVWELNAETRESLMNSFKDLAYAFARTKDQRDELAFIQDIQDTEEKEKQLLSFVKNQLKQNKDWLLIYDNVESFSDIKFFFPRDPEIWGKGEVIITTQDKNIQNTSHVKFDNTILVDELNPDEALAFFCKILYSLDPSQLTAEKRESAKAFLTHIPHFPLDVSLTAYYIKSSQITYEQYLDRINRQSKKFDVTQEKLIKEISDYAKTRNSIIKLSFQKLIENNPEIKDLLLLICLLDSQNISKKFLEFYKDPVVVENFIHELKKYSLTTDNSVKKDEDNEVTFSIHRSTQSHGRTYLIELLSEEEKRTILAKIISTIQSFYEAHVEKKHSTIRASIPHFQAFLRTLQTINLPKELKDKYTQELQFILGYSHKRCFRNLILEKQYLSDAYHLQKTTHLFPDKKLAILLKDLSSTCADLESADEAELYAQESLKILKNVPQSEMLIEENCRLLGYAYTYKNDFERAQFYLNEALKVITHLEPKLRKESESDIYAKLAWLYSVTYITGDRTIEAKKYIHKALEIMNGNDIFYDKTLSSQKPLSYYIYVARHKTTLGDIYCRSGDYKGAMTQGFREVQYIIDHALNHYPHHLLKVYIDIGLGEVCLREDNLEEAKIKITNTIRETERIAGKNSTLALSSKVFLVETKVRLGELVEAYSECLSALETDKKVNTNYFNLMYFLGHYHAGVIQSKLGNFQKSLEHFSNFLNEMKPFCSRFFDKKTFEDLEAQRVFEINQQDSINTAAQHCLHKSAVILMAIYGFNHPFIKDYVLKNERT